MVDCLRLQLHRATAHVPLSTVASFRTWQSSELPIAWCAAFNAIGRDCFGNVRPACPAWTPVSGFRATGHRYLPVLYGSSSIEAEMFPVNPSLLQLREGDGETARLSFRDQYVG